MQLKPSLLLAMFCSPAFPCFAQQPPAPLVSYYDVTGQTADAVRAQINRNSPTETNGKHVDGMTKHAFAYKYRIIGIRGGCRFERFDATLEQFVSLPRWVDIDLDSEAGRRWQAYSEALYRHEMGHVERGTAALDELRALPRRVAIPMKCADADAIVRGAFREFLARTEKVQADYDAQTMHGEMQGAVFP